MATKVNTIARDPDTCDMFLDAYGNIALASGKEAYAQIVNAKMRTTLGELQLDMRKGLPYFETVFSNAALLDIWRASAVEMLEALPFVISVDSFICQIEGNVVKYTSEIRTDSGVIQTNG